jgi:tricorn protease
VTLTVSNGPNGAASRRDGQADQERTLRARAGLDRSNRAIVDKLSGGRIGYVYMSDMEALGMQQFIRQFYPQMDKAALIVDDRYNGGGNIDQIVLERCGAFLPVSRPIESRRRNPFRSRSWSGRKCA